MRNRFPGTCYRCGEHVEAGAGHFERMKDRRGWRVQHAHCAIKYRGTDHQYNKPGVLTEDRAALAKVKP